MRHRDASAVTSLNPHDERFEQLLHLERKLSYRTMPRDPDSGIQVVEGELPVLVSAAHSCAHQRSGMMKMEEEFTAAMAGYCAREFGCSAIFLCNASHEDPNDQKQALYKERLQALCCRCGIRFVIDLHGMINRHGMGVALGTMNDRACNSEQVAHGFLQAGFELIDEAQLSPGYPLSWRRLVLNHSRFTGGIRRHTVTRFAVEELGLSAVQVELASMCRVIYSAPGEGWPHAYAGLPRAVAASLDAIGALVLAATRGDCR